MQDQIITEIAADILISMMKNPNVNIRSEDLPSIAANHAKALIEAVDEQLGHTH